MNDSKPKLENLNDLFDQVTINLKAAIGPLYEKVTSLNSLINDPGEKMNEEIRIRWKQKFDEALLDCETNPLGLPDGIAATCKAILLFIQARFNEYILGDTICAGDYYELASEVLQDMSKPELETSAAEIMRQVLLHQDPYDEQPLIVAIALLFGLPVAELKNRAGDAYYKAGDFDAASKSYNSGLKIIEQKELKDLGEDINTAFSRLYVRLSLSIANIHFDDKQQVALSYKNAADKIFFSVEKRSGKTYRDICDLLANGNPELLLMVFERDWVPVLPVIPAKTKADTKDLLLLKAEIGERALEVLNGEYLKTEEFSLEGYILVATLAKTYFLLGEYEKCETFIEQYAGFRDSFFEFGWEEIVDHRDWVYGFIDYQRTLSESRGLLQRPGFQELSQVLKESSERTRESLQRVELKQTRMEKKLENEPAKYSRDRIEDDLSRKYSWLEHTALKGSIVNAQLLTKSLKEHNWGEVIAGYCNAVEAELKQYVYKEYLQYFSKIGTSNDLIGESQQQLTKGSVLYKVAHVADNNMTKAVWDQFLANKSSEEKEFLASQLPLSLNKLITIRNQADHGVKMEEATEVEAMVMGTSNARGLLDRLDVLRQKYGNKST